MSIDAYTTAGQTLQFPSPISSTRDPTTSDIISPSGSPYLAGQEWINTSLSKSWSYVGAGNWVLLGSGSTGGVTSITGDTGGAEVPSSGNFNLKGTANQISVTGSANTETFALIGPYTPATYTAHGPLIGEGTSSIVAATPGTNGQVFLGSTGADPAFGTLTTSTGVAFTTGAASLAVNIASGGFKVNAASTGGTLVAQNLYNVTQAGATSFALPATAAVGDVFMITSAQSNTGGWVITQAAGQEIWANTNHTTNGATGTLTGAKSCAVELTCTVANLEFIITGGSGLTGLTFA